MLYSATVPLLSFATQGLRCAILLQVVQRYVFPVSIGGLAEDRDRVLVGADRLLQPPRVPISEVSRWLGHKSITTTVDLYGHLVPEASGRARDALDRAFASAGMCPESAPTA